MICENCGAFIHCPSCCDFICPYCGSELKPPSVRNFDEEEVN